jgi:UDP-GlcNAc:undecaprenyl-phosphate GlcNAc-1-phosphate transferase
MVNQVLNNRLKGDNMKLLFLEIINDWHQYSRLIFVFLLSFLFTYISIPLIIKYAERKQLFDVPNERKVHTKKISSFGGIGMIIGVIASSLFWLDFDLNSFQPYLFLSILLLFFMGLVDDLKDLSPKIRFAGQIVAAALMAYSGLRIESLNGVLGIYELHISIQYVFTIFLVIGVINALNMIDGIDGLAGGLSLISFSFFAFLFIIHDDLVFAVICVSFAAVILSFLRYNFPPAKIFMGDSGSIVLGFILTISGIRLITMKYATSTGGYDVSELMVLVFGALILPVYDTIRVSIARLINSKSPFYADKTHVHHLILNEGFSHKRTSLVLYSIHLLLIILAFLIKEKAAGFSVLALFLITILLYELLTLRRIMKSRAIEKKSEQEIRKFEIKNRLLADHFKKENKK